DCDLLEHGGVAGEVGRGGEEARREAEGLGRGPQGGGEGPPHRSEGEDGGDEQCGVLGEGGQAASHRGSFRAGAEALTAAGALLTGRRRNVGPAGTGGR